MAHRFFEVITCILDFISRLRRWVRPCELTRAAYDEPGTTTKEIQVEIEAPQRMGQSQMLLFSGKSPLHVQTRAMKIISFLVHVLDVAHFPLLGLSIFGRHSVRGVRSTNCRSSPCAEEPGDSPRPILKSERDVEHCGETVVTGFGTIRYDIHENIRQIVEFRDIFRFKPLSKSCKKPIESDHSSQSRGVISTSEGTFTAINYYIKNKNLQCSGFDLHSKSWIALPSFSCLPPPDAELFKEYFVSGHSGLMCADISKLPKKGELVVFNPLTGKSKALPPLLNPRSPVLVHIFVNSAERFYKVIVAGSSTAGDEHLSKKMELFDSSTSEWKETRDLPGPAFGLNEHQAGVCLNGILFFISFLANKCCRCVVAFDVRNGKWRKDLACPIPFSAYSNTLQLVESDGKLYLFSEQEQGHSVEHCIDELQFSYPNAGATACQWRNVVRVMKSGGRGLLVYPEHTCVGFGEGKLCIFNALNRDGVVYDVRDGRQCEELPPPPADQTGDNFFSLNPSSFTLRPSFSNDP